MAVGAGVKVVAVASKHNFDNVKELGAAAVFDYNSPSVADDIISALQGTSFIGVCDCISSAQSAAAWVPVYKKLGGRYGGVMPLTDHLPEGIQGASIYGPWVALKDRYVGEAVWQKWIPEALEKGTMKAKPDPIVAGKGLESIQAGLDKQKQGVSFQKVVIEL